MKKTMKKVVAGKPYSALRVGEAVLFVDANGVEYKALVKTIGAPDSVHVIYVDEGGNCQEAHSVGLKATDENKARYVRI